MHERDGLGQTDPPRAGERVPRYKTRTGRNFQNSLRFLSDEEEEEEEEEGPEVRLLVARKHSRRSRFPYDGIYVILMHCLIIKLVLRVGRVGPNCAVKIKTGNPERKSK